MLIAAFDEVIADGGNEHGDGLALDVKGDAFLRRHAGAEEVQDPVAVRVGLSGGEAGGEAGGDGNE